MTAQPLDSRYALEDRIGQGAVGAVWRGRDRATGTLRAIRLLPPEVAADPAVVARFERERTALLRLRHPNVVTLHEVIIEDGLLALVTDLVTGGTLAARRQQAGGALEPAVAAGLAGQAAAGLAAAHAGGVVHGDVRPASILLDSDTVKVADAGVARLAGPAAGSAPAAGPGPGSGTAPYLAPEVIGGQPPSAAADIYAAGVTLYELLAGEPPFGGDAAAVLRAHLEAMPVPPAGVPEGLWELVSGCLSKRPAARPTAADLVRALRDPWILRGAAVMMSALPPVLAATPVAPGGATTREAAAREAAERQSAEHEKAAVEAAADEDVARQAARETAPRGRVGRHAAAPEAPVPGAAGPAAQQATGQDAAGQDAAGQDATGPDATGPDAAAGEAAARYAAAQGVAARELAAHEDAAWQASERAAAGRVTGRHASGRPAAESESVWFQAAAARQAAALGAADRAAAAPGLQQPGSAASQPGTAAGEAAAPVSADRVVPDSGDEAETIVPGAPPQAGAGSAAGTSLPAITAPILSDAPGQPPAVPPEPAGPQAPGPRQREGRRRRRMAAFAAATTVVAVAAVVTVIRLGASHATPVANSGPDSPASADARSRASASPGVPATGSPAPRHPAGRRPVSLSGREAMPAPSPTATTAWKCGPAAAAKLSTGAAAAGVTLQACIRAVHGQLVLRGILRGAVTSPAEQIVLVLKNAAQQDVGKPRTSGACTTSACTYLVTVSPGKGQWTVLPKWELGGTFQSAGRESGFISN